MGGGASEGEKSESRDPRPKGEGHTLNRRGTRSPGASITRIGEKVATCTMSHDCFNLRNEALEDTRAGGRGSEDGVWKKEMHCY